MEILRFDLHFGSNRSRRAENCAACLMSFSMKPNDYQSMKTDELRAAAKALGVLTRVEGTKKWRPHADLVALCAEKAQSGSAQPLAGCSAGRPPDPVAQESAGGSAPGSRQHVCSRTPPRGAVLGVRFETV